MKCAVHSDLDAVGYCRNCGKPLCQQCSREVRGALYCEQCLANMMAPPPAAAAQFAPTAPPPTYVYAAPVEHTGPNPGTACALGFIPGLGAVYNGEYIKGLIHVIIFGGLIGVLSNSDNMPDGVTAMIAVFFAIFYCYMPIEAYRTARAKRLGLPVTGFFGETAPVAVPGAEPSSEGAAPVRRNYTGSIILILLGAFFLLATTGLLSSRWMWNFLLPLVLIGVGVALIFKRRAT
jgi:hypothetical protein